MSFNYPFLRYKCKECGKKFRTEVALKIHDTKKHTKYFQMK
jgi:DNA-directed RNA polymerase subunit RPC12/RpoP